MEAHHPTIKKNKNIWCSPSSQHKNTDLANESKAISESIKDVSHQNLHHNSMKGNIDYLMLERDINGKSSLGKTLRFNIRIGRW